MQYTLSMHKTALGPNTSRFVCALSVSYLLLPPLVHVLAESKLNEEKRIGSASVVNSAAVYAVNVLLLLFCVLPPHTPQLR